MQLGSQGELNSELKTKIDNILQKDKIVLFMKGSKDFPQCGFSDTVVKVLKFYGADFTTGQPSRNSISITSLLAAVTLF